MQIVSVASTSLIEIATTTTQSVVVSISTASFSGSNLTNPIDLGEIDTTNVGDGYVFVYKASTQTYGFVNPDEMLSKSVEDGVLPTTFINKIDDELDDKIDADGGVF